MLIWENKDKNGRQSFDGKMLRVMHVRVSKTEACEIIVQLARAVKGENADVVTCATKETKDGTEEVGFILGVADKAK